ncbi:MAG: methyltransferase domain-containing protein [Euryarchaeota archaeon]|nr:methyltransferase domain-containing protein [Euryarchaeota archaeon]
MVHKALLVSATKKGKEFLVKSEGELHTDDGVIDLNTLKTLEYGSIVSTHLGAAFRVIKPRAPDYFHHLKRSGAPMMPKDIGALIAHTGLTSDDVVLDAGTGSGITAIFLGSIAREVITYEIKGEFAKRARENVKQAGLTNVQVIDGDVLEISSKKAFDVITLDLYEISKAIDVVKEFLVPGGFIATFSPFYEQAFEARRRLEGLSQITTFEASEREIQFGKRGTRPVTRVGHTGFITVARG